MPHDISGGDVPNESASQSNNGLSRQASQSSLSTPNTQRRRRAASLATAAPPAGTVPTCGIDAQLHQEQQLDFQQLQDTLKEPLLRRDGTLVTAEKPLRVTVIHGDPTLPNPILPGGKWDQDDFESLESAKTALNTLNERSGHLYEFRYLCCHATLIEDLRQTRDSIDLVLQLCDEGWQNHPRMEMHVIGFLEMLGLPYTGSSAKCIALTYDKQAVLQVAASVGVPVPKSIFIDNDSKLLQHGLPYPVLLKPNSTDGSFGITARSVAHNDQELLGALSIIRDDFCLEGPVLVQEYLTGRDLNVALVGTKPCVLPMTEEDYGDLPAHLPRICGFESKWDAASPYWKIVTRPSTQSATVQRHIREWSQRVFNRVGISDYARLDWRLDAQGQPRLLEANPNCGWCWDGHLPKTLALAGIDYPHFFALIMRSALKRAILDKQQAATKRTFSLPVGFGTGQ